jgi:chromosomal replication initiator protein
MADIRAIVCRHFDLTSKEMLSSARHERVVRPRQVGMHLARQMTWQGLPSIARHFGRSDHTTALYADRRIKAMRAADPTFNAKVRAVVADVHRVTRDSVVKRGSFA